LGGFFRRRDRAFSLSFGASAQRTLFSPNNYRFGMTPKSPEHRVLPVKAKMTIWNCGIAPD
jgi:hypothetical protein